MSVVSRDLTQAKAALSRWLRGQLPGATGVELGELSVPSIGFSGEIILFDASWTADGQQHERGFAIRVEPTSHQIFMDTNFVEQYRVQEALGRTEVPVAPTIGFEVDPSVLGARFYALEKRSGRAYDVQTNPDSFVLALPDDKQERLCHNFLDVLAAIHLVDHHELDLDFMSQEHRGATAMDQHLQYYREYYEWGRAGEHRPVIEQGFQWMDDHRPDVMPPTGLVWGDARMGNQLWDEEQRCTAVLDWEMCTLGPAEEDFAWFLLQDHATPTTATSDNRESISGTVVPPGVPSIEATTAYYEAALGRPLQHLEYFTVWPPLRTAVIITRLSPLLEELGVPLLANAGETAVAELLGIA